MKYTPPIGSSDQNAPYVDANPVAGIQGSAVPAESIEAPQREIIAVIEAANLTPVKADKTQLKQAIETIIEQNVSDKPTVIEVNQKLSLKADIDLLNINAIGKKAIVSLGMPDYSKSIQTGMGGNAPNYTAPANGVIELHTSGTTPNSFVNILTNGRTYSCSNGGNTGGNSNSVQISFPKESSYSVISSSGSWTISFIPSAGAI